MEREERIRAKLISEGASLVGFADLTDIMSTRIPGLNRGISIVSALKSDIIRQITDGPTPLYHEEYKRVNKLLYNLSRLAESLLHREGYQAVALEPTTEDYDPVNLCDSLPHKTVATRAGLGWIGKSALLITPQYGAALRLSSVLTNAPINAGTPVNISSCGNCLACVDACPADAHLGINWSAGLPRESFYNAFACRDMARSLSDRAGIDSTICGICVAVCPWTQKYINRQNEI